MQNGQNGRNQHQNGNKGKTGTVTFNMARLTDAVANSGSAETLAAHSVNCEATKVLGPVVDDGAPYSGMGLDEFRQLQSTIMPTWDDVLDPLPAVVADRPFWQYGKGKHASKPRKILESLFLTILSDQGTPVSIRHLLIEGSSQWVIGRNVTANANIIHLNGNFLQLPANKSGFVNTPQLTDHDFHSFLPRDRFYH